MKKILLYKGLPCSGKTTAAKELLKKEPGLWKRINRDDLRYMLDDYAFSKDNEALIRDVKSDLIRRALVGGWNVVCDDTHLQAAARKEVHKVAESVGDVEVIERFFECNATDSKARADQRHIKGLGPLIPGESIQKMAKLIPDARKDGSKTYKRLIPAVYNGNGEPTIICDLDGTLALFEGLRGPYETEKCANDKVNEPVARALYRWLESNQGAITFVSGREEKYREQTIAFLAKAGFYLKDYNLYMRPTGDMRPDDEIKREIFDKHIRGKEIECVFDDRPRVVRMWRSLGLTVFQLNDKEF